MAGNAVMELILLPLFMTTVPPLMLRINHLVVHVPSRCVRFLAGSCFSAIVLFISSMFMYFLMGSLLLAATQFILPAFAAFVLAFGVLFFVNCFFCSSRQRWPTKGGKKHALFKRHLSKRCIYIYTLNLWSSGLCPEVWRVSRKKHSWI